tara:strand:- start:1038 stop:1547 length:510 start_codon:yes stop_codon:yes gene_type:complete
MRISAPVLVLNQNYQPLNICNVRRAVVLVCVGKAEIITNGNMEIKSISSILPEPTVIRLSHMVKRPTSKSKLSRKAVFFRDNFTCQYCNNKTTPLTLDHVIPRSKGGAHTWENVTSACIKCNHKKASKTPREASMKLISKPLAPRPNPYNIFIHRKIEDDWIPFIPWSA